MAGRPTRSALAGTIAAALAVAGPVFLSAPIASAAAPTELFFSEYIEGSSNNKALEIYNGTGGAVDLGTAGYNVQMFFNGGATPGLTVNLTGTVATGDVFVLAQSSASAAILAEADQTNGAGWFNGDDAVVLRKGTNVVDVVGQVGFDPGTEWGTALTSTGDNTLRRKADICAGDTDGSNVFDPAVEWDGSATDAVDGLGAHAATCSDGPPADPQLSEIRIDQPGTDNDEYIELSGSAGTSLDGLTLLVLGDGTGGSGVIENVVDLNGQSIGSTGYFVVAESTFSLGVADLVVGTGLNFENSDNVTQLLVRDFTGAGSQDLDTDEDGVLDVTPWSEVVDRVALILQDNPPTTTELHYGPPTVGPDGIFVPGHVFRCDDGWRVGAFDPSAGDDTPGAANGCEVEPPPPAITFIHAIQGTGITSPLVGQSATVEAVVTAVKPGVSGYYLQEEDGDADSDPATSEGIFVFSTGTVGQVEVGDLVRVAGTIGEFTSSTGAGSSQTQLTNVTVQDLVADVPLPTTTAVTFPVSSTTYLEQYEGMLVELVDELVISEYFNYDRFGEVVLAKPLDGEDRLHTPTAVVDPGSAAQELAAQHALRIITLDDSSRVQNPTVIPHPGNGEPFSNTNTFRGGDTITGVEGVIDHTFGLYRIQPTEYGDYETANPRPVDSPGVGGTIQVASFNVLNYFLTIDEGPDVCGPLADQDCRGADSQAEFDRQRVKILEALEGLDADVVGLIEMENTPGVEPAADLVEGLNDRLGAGTYDYIDTSVIGTDAIRLGFIYKPGTVRPVGDYAILDSAADPRFVDTRNRPMLTQTFEEVATRERVTVSVNHLKSKGSGCGAGDPDTGDGQGNCNLTRLAAAQAIVDFLAGDPTESDDPDHLVIGDLNSYDREDPIQALVGAGYTDLIAEFGGEFAYGYVFDGKVGYLDHALSNEPLTSQVTGAAEWHVNADEPDILDYNVDFGRPATFFAPDRYRSSDHDPVLVGLDLDGPADLVSDLRETLAEMDLQLGITNALDAKLRAAERAIGRGDDIAACENMQSFIDQVNALTGKKLTPEQAEGLVEDAVALRRALDC